MTDEPVEDLTYDFLEESFESAPNDSILKNLELHETLFKKFKTPAGVRIGDAQSSLSRNAEYQMKEFDAVFTLVCYAEILGADKGDRRAARRKAFQISLALADLFDEHDTMNGRVCRVRLLDGVRGWDSINSKPYAVANIPVVFNESGEINFDKRRNY